jgi:hypothetical protein
MEQNRAILGQFLTRYQTLEAGPAPAAAARMWPMGDD